MAQTDLSTLRTSWQAVYGDTPMLGHVLRTRFPERWLRIHNLPGSKRYGETEDEYRELLSRQHRVFGDLIGDGQRCFFVFCYYDDALPLVDDLRSLMYSHLGTLDATECELARDYPLHAVELTWSGGFESILRAVADDVLETPLFVSPSATVVLAPYDGGMDLFIEPALRGQLRERYREWLPPRDDGL